MWRTLPVVLALACSPAAAPRDTTEPTGVSADDHARDVCVTTLRRTRTCEDDYVPALLALRVRHDHPAGIAARYENEGEDVLLAIAHEEFARDWSEAGIAAHCQRLLDMPDAQRDEVVLREQACVPAQNCVEFVACHMDNLDRRWSAQE